MTTAIKIHTTDMGGHFVALHTATTLKVLPTGGLLTRDEAIDAAADFANVYAHAAIDKATGRRLMIRQMCSGDARLSTKEGHVVNRRGWEWLRDCITLEDIQDGADLDFPIHLTPEDADTYQGVTYPSPGERMA